MSKTLLNLLIAIIIVFGFIFLGFIGVSKYIQLQSQLETKIESRLSKENQSMIENMLLKEQIKQKNEEIEKLNLSIKELKNSFVEKEKNIQNDFLNKEQKINNTVISLNREKSQTMTSLNNQIKLLDQDNKTLLEKQQLLEVQRKELQSNLEQVQENFNKCNMDVRLLKEQHTHPISLKKEVPQKQEKKVYIDEFKPHIYQKPRKKDSRPLYPKVDELN